MRVKVASSTPRITIHRIAILGFFLALTITFKWVFGFVPGIEIVSFLFIIYGIFLPFVDLALLIVAFNILVMVIYGFGGWWLAYWVIWPVDALISKLLGKFTNNRFIFAFWGFIAGTSVLFWYFLSDWIFFGYSFAVLNIISAIPVNLIEGFTTMFMIIIVAPVLIKVLNHYAPTFWTDKNNFYFRDVKYLKLGAITNVTLALGTIAGSVALFAYNSTFLNWKSNMHHFQYRNHELPANAAAPSGWNLLNPHDYNQIYQNLDNHEVGVVVIANNKVYSEEVSTKNVIFVLDALQHGQDFHFKYTLVSTPPFHNEAFVGSFQIKDTNTWLHGTSNQKNYGDYYPMIAVDHQYAPLGVSLQKIEPRDIIELTYDFALF